MHAPYQRRIDIDIHGRGVVDSVILLFLREAIFSDTFDFMGSQAESGTKEKNKWEDADHLELSLLCEVVKEDHPEGAGTGSQPYLN
jgi:hypothetical protein